MTALANYNRGSEPPRSVDAKVTVKNDYQNSSTAPDALTIQRVDAYDVRLVAVEISDFSRCGNGNRHHCFSISPVIRNDGPDWKWDGVVVSVHTDAGDIQLRSRAPLAPHSEIQMDAQHGSWQRSNRARVRVHGTDTNPDNNEGSFRISRNGRYPYSH